MKYYFTLILLFILVLVRTYLTCYYKKDANTCESMTTNFTFGKTYRENLSKFTRKFLPSPHSELLLGMVLGVDEISKVPSFEEALRDTGTIHVVVVSGFNISLVFGMILKLFGSQYKLKNMVGAQLCTFLYALLTGFEPPVIRAWIMGSIASWGKYYGRSIDALRILTFSCLIMVLISPSFIFSLSFQLSFSATLSLILFGNIFSKKLKLEGFILEDFLASLSAQILVWPLISCNFGTVSIISLLVNALVLWTVSIATSLGGLFLIVGSLWEPLAYLLSLVVFPFLDFFIKIVTWLSKFSFASIEFKLSLQAFLSYYFVVILWLIFEQKRMKNKADRSGDQSLTTLPTQNEIL